MARTSSSGWANGQGRNRVSSHPHATGRHSITTADQISERETKRKRLAEDQPPPPSVNAETDNSVDLALSGAQAFPTPAQRAPPTKQLPRDPASQTPVKSADPTPVSVKALETKSVTPEIKPVDAKAKSPWDVSSASLSLHAFYLQSDPTLTSFDRTLIWTKICHRAISSPPCRTVVSVARSILLDMTQ